MANDIPVNVNDETEITDFLLNVHEKYYCELKTASNLPKSFWESYSSFCNTAGGLIILGVKENEPQNEIFGVGNESKIIADLWSLLSNPNKVSCRTIDNEDVLTKKVGEAKIIFIHVPEAHESQKPVYLDGKQEKTYIRTGDGDRLATSEEINAFIRNAHPGADSIYADHCSMEDLDSISITSFKAMVHKRYPKKKYIEMDNEEFLVQIGACTRKKDTGSLRIKRGTVLFLGKYNAIKELYPVYHLDYFNKRGSNPRWSDRISDDEPNDDEMNIFNFYSQVYAKLKAVLQDSFQLDEEYQLRLPVSDFDETIRECLVNCLAHADYIQGFPSTKIEVYDGWFRFDNPGKMLVSKAQFIMGGDSRPRNEIVMKFFRLLGASERQGFGGPLIYKSAYEHQYRNPEVETNLEHTELRVWNIDLADSYPNLEQEQKAVIRLIMKNGPLSVHELLKYINISDYKLRKLLVPLEGNLLQKIGKGPSTKYDLMPRSVEKLTQLQIAMDHIQKHWIV